ncbi:MAG: SDR family oxidoreductase [Ignavibacteria bacterium]|nr:SDR family oxidoreductase [Ignavibacteria bacterium]
MEIKLEGKIALVCGASQGIGKAIAECFAFAGAKVIALARNEAKLQQLINHLSERTQKVHHYIAIDIGNIELLKVTTESFFDDVGYPDILVNNTGGPSAGKLINASISELIQAYYNHILSAQTLTQVLIPKMKDKRFGRIINIVSIGLRQPIDNLGVSNTIRGAMGSWAKTLSRELAPFGITVNNILPGFTLTERLKELVEKKADENKTNFEYEINKLVESVPAKRLGLPSDIAYLATFLASEFANYINGVSIPVDGGFLSCI